MELILQYLGQGSLRRSSSASFSPHVHFDLNSDVESISPESLNLSSSVEITIRHLKDRVDELEQARVSIYNCIRNSCACRVLYYYILKLSSLHYFQQIRILD